MELAKATSGPIELRRHGLVAGSIKHAEFRIDDTAIMIGDAGFVWLGVSADRSGQSQLASPSGLQRTTR